MPRPAKPWWHAQKKKWCCRHNGKLIILGSDHASSLRAFHRLKSSTLPPPLPSSSTTCAEILDRYLDRQQKHRAHATYVVDRIVCQQFAEFIGDRLAAELRPIDVTTWADRYQWSNSTRRGKIAQVQAAFRWADRVGLHRPNPISYVEKPPPENREDMVPPDLWPKILAESSGDLRAMLEFCRLVGCRPQEAKGLEARHVSADGSVITIPRPEAKGKRRPRVIYVPAKGRKGLVAICRLRPTGRLYLNARGRPWTASAVRIALGKIARTLGMPRLYQYMLRHTWITEALRSGLSVAVVAELAGHSAETALKIYGHLDQHSAELKRAAEKATKRKA